MALRYDEDKRKNEDRLFPGSALEDTFDLFQPKVQLSYDWTEEIMTYFSWGRGFRSGLFNDVLANSLVGTPRLVKQEESDSFEIGLKARFFDGRLAINSALFHTDFKDQQFFFFDLFTFTQNTININDTSIDGLEVELIASELFLQGLDLTASVGVIDAEIDDFDGSGMFEGNTSPNSNSYTLNLTGQYVRPLFKNVSLMTRIEYQYLGKLNLRPANVIRQRASDFLNLRVFLQTDKWSIGGYARNLTNEKILLQGTEPDLGGRFRNEPRTYGIEVSYRF